MLRPLYDRIVVDRAADTGEEKTEGGIVIPGTVRQDKPHVGTVVATGPGRALKDGSLAPLQVKVGDVVLFTKYAGSDIKIGNKEYAVMQEVDVLGVLE